MKLADHRNEDGTYNGVTLFAELTGLSQNEIRWTFNRAQALKREGKTAAEIKAILKTEGEHRPWAVQ